MQSASHGDLAKITDNLYIARQLLMFGLHLYVDVTSSEPSSTSDAECAPSISRGASLRAFTMKNATLALQCARDVQPDTDLAKSIDEAIKRQTQDDDCLVAMVQVVENLLTQIGAAPKKSQYFGDFNYGDDKIFLDREVVGHETGRLLYDRLPPFLGGGFEHEPDFIPREPLCTLSLEVALSERSLGGSGGLYQQLNPVRWNFPGTSLIKAQVPPATVTAAATVPVEEQKQE